jgi:hypothetical protein
MHTAWLVAASIVSTNLAAVAVGASSSAQISLAWASEMTAAVCTAGLSLYFNEPTFALVGAWALRAISKSEAPEEIQKKFNPEQRQSIQSFAGNAAVALAVLGLTVAVRGQVL